MPEVLVLDDVEDVLCRHLAAQLLVPWSTRIPRVGAGQERPLAFGRLYIIGGQATGLVVHRVRLQVDVYAHLESEAWPLAQQAMGVIGALGRVEGIQFYRPQLQVPANLPDPDIRDRVRYAANPAVGVRARAA